MLYLNKYFVHQYSLHFYVYCSILYFKLVFFFNNTGFYHHLNEPLRYLRFKTPSRRVAYHQAPSLNIIKKFKLLFCPTSDISKNIICYLSFLLKSYFSLENSLSSKNKKYSVRTPSTYNKAFIIL